MRKLDIDYFNSKPNHQVCLKESAGEGQHDSLTYRQVNAKVEKLAARLISKKITRLALFADNSSAWIIVDLACQRAQVTLIPLPLFFTSAQIVHALTVCSVSHVISDRPIYLSTFLRNGEMEICPVTGLCVQTIHSDDVVASLPIDTSKITFTSGSTGYPKGVCLSVENQMLVAESLVNKLSIGNARHLCVLPLGVLLENVAGVYAALLSGGEVIVPSLIELGFSGSSNIDISVLTQFISGCQPDTLICLPEMLVGLIKAVESGWTAPISLKFVAVGGAKVSPLLIAKAIDLGIPVYEGYGLSECASVVSVNTPGSNQIGSIGRQLDHSAVRIEENEFVVYGNVFLGYVDDPDSWYPNCVKTGDLGWCDNQKNLFINGRKKNVLVTSFGRNIHPEWIESEILRNPLIAHAVVFGDAKPFCIALIATRRADISNEVIQNWIDMVNSQLPDYARIQRWHRLAKPLFASDGLVTENGRPKRSKIEIRFSNIIEALYKSKSTHQDENLSEVKTA